jgi:hypothetical protein
MKHKSRTAPVTLKRTPAPEIQRTRPRADEPLPVARDERPSGRSGGGGPCTAPLDRDQLVGDVTFGGETIDLDVPAVAAALSQRLHRAGLPVTPERAMNLAQALTLVRPVSRRQLYCTVRAVCVSSPAHLPAFDRVFVSVFGSWPNAEECPNDPEAVEDWRHASAA